MASASTSEPAHGPASVRATLPPASVSAWKHERRRNSKKWRHSSSTTCGSIRNYICDITSSEPSGSSANRHSSDWVVYSPHVLPETCTEAPPVCPASSRRSHHRRRDCLDRGAQAPRTHREGERRERRIGVLVMVTTLFYPSISPTRFRSRSSRILRGFLACVSVHMSFTTPHSYVMSFPEITPSCSSVGCFRYRLRSMYPLRSCDVMRRGISCS